MKIHEYNSMMKWLVRKPDKYSKEEKKKIVKDFYKKAEQPKSKILDWINYNNKAFGNNKEPVTPDEAKVAKVVEERFNDRIQEQDRAKKKKTLIAEKAKPKPTYLNGNVIDMMPFLPDEEWWKIFEEEPPEDKVLIRKPRRTAQGIQTILALHKNKI